MGRAWLPFWHATQRERSVLTEASLFRTRPNHVHTYFVKYPAAEYATPKPDWNLTRLFPPRVRVWRWRLNALVVIKAKHFYDFKLITEDFPFMQEALEKPMNSSGKARSQTMPGHRTRFWAVSVQGLQTCSPWEATARRLSDHWTHILQGYKEF